MSEQIPWELIIPVVGVGVGWLLSQLTDLIKDWRRKNMIKRALTNELLIIRKAFYDALKTETKNLVLKEQYPFITETYDSLKIELASFLKPDSLAKVQRTYKEISKLNTEGGRSYQNKELDYIFQFTDFNKLIELIDDSIVQLDPKIL
jgi:hypothetical protein